MLYLLYMLCSGWYVGRGDCGVGGWKDRCRDGNLRTYCHASPILFGWFFVEASPTCFCIFVKCFFCNLFPGIFLGLFWDSIPTCSLNFTCNLFLLFFGGKRDHLMWFC